jgi:single-strand DNA-binding protein
MSINRVCISGNLTRDPEMRATAGGMAIMQIRMAVNDRRKNPQSGEWEDAPNYVDVVVFGQRAESLSRFLSKGSKIIVDGKLRWSEWADKDSGAKRSKLEVVADDIDFASGRGESGGGGSYAGPTTSASSAPSPEPVFEDDIPF